jgi:hypothetical protein
MGGMRAQDELDLHPERVVVPDLVPVVEVVLPANA